MAGLESRKLGTRSAKAGMSVPASLSLNRPDGTGAVVGGALRPADSVPGLPVSIISPFSAMVPP